ncbi:MAG: hypothetical protein RSA10_01725 [Bacilli bacterium]
MNINLCYIIASCLLCEKDITLEELSIIKNRLFMLNPNYKVDISINNIISVIDEWKDFFKFKDKNTIVLATDNISLLTLVVYDILDDKIKDDLHTVIKSLNKSKKSMCKE